MLCIYFDVVCHCCCRQFSLLPVWIVRNVPFQIFKDSKIPVDCETYWRLLFGCCFRIHFCFALFHLLIKFVCCVCSCLSSLPRPRFQLDSEQVWWPILVCCFCRDALRCWFVRTLWRHSIRAFCSVARIGPNSGRLNIFVTRSNCYLLTLLYISENVFIEDRLKVDLIKWFCWSGWKTKWQWVGSMEMWWPLEMQIIVNIEQPQGRQNAGEHVQCNTAISPFSSRPSQPVHIGKYEYSANHKIYISHFKII